MKLRYARILSLLLCAALACSILAGCGGSTASSSEAPSSASSSASSAASGEDLSFFHQQGESFTDIGEMSLVIGE